MSEQNEKLTAAQLKELASERAIKYADDIYERLHYCVGFRAGYSEHAQQVEHATAELRKELGTQAMHILQLSGQKSDLKDQIESLKTQLAEAQRQRDEAAMLLQTELPTIVEVMEEAESVADFQGTASHDTVPEAKAWESKWKSCIERLRGGLSRLSSGETKPESAKPLWECYEYHRANMPAYGCTQQCAECAEEQSKKSKPQ